MVPRAAYGGRVPALVGGGVVASVDAGSPAALGGIVGGDVIVTVDGQPLRDIVDWQWLTDGEAITVATRHGQTIRTEELRRGSGENWGVQFADAVFDGVRTCRNRCTFCFMTQLPKGLRRALYLRDDDYRLSFLQGNFITLTNLADADVTRIAEQRLSPLYVSLHAVDPAVRRELVCAREDRALQRFDELLDAGIDLHVQIVLVPGINDGEVLDRSLTWLAKREGVLSVGIVPLGFTAHQQRFSASYGQTQQAGAIVDQVAPWQVASRERDGLTWVHLADEFYLNASREFPAAKIYDGYPQYENGIGLVRSFLDDFGTLRPQLGEAAAALPVGLRVAVVSGELFAPVLERMLGGLHTPARVWVVPAENRFFGGNVSVAGLLTAGDILPAIASVPDAHAILVPSIVANAEGLLLDDVPASELGMRSGRDVRLLSCDAGGLLGGLRELAR